MIFRALLTNTVAFTAAVVDALFSEREPVMAGAVDLRPARTVTGNPRK